MSEKYKIKINAEMPSDKEIEKSKDFSKVMNSTQEMYNPLKMRQGMHRKRKMMLMVIAVISVALALLATSIE
jgi:hypothetical protein